MSRLGSDYRERYDAVLQKVGNLEVESRQLCAFWPAIGSRFDNGILAIGRAVNGWGSTDFSASQLRESAKRSEVIMKAKNYRAQDGDPLSWVAERKGDDGDYSTNRSQFWMALKSLFVELDGRSDPQWSSRLAWSNLYKVAPKETGNPSGPLKTIQREEEGVRLLEGDIKHVNPRMVLFLTGPGWAGHFLDQMRVDRAVRNGKGAAVEAGIVSDLPFVVSRHPQGKKRNEWVTETIELMRQVRAA